MKGFSQPHNRKLLIAVLVPLLALATVALAVMQFRWISRAAESERERNLISLLRDGSRAVNQAFDEIRVLATILRSSSGSSRDAEITFRVQGALAGWSDQASFPGIIKGVWVLYPGAVPKFITPYTADSVTRDPAPGKPGGDSIAQNSAAELPRELIPLTERFLDTERSERLITALGVYGYAVTPVRTADNTTGFAVIVVHLDRFLDEVLPFYLDRNISGNTYSIDRMIQPDSDVPRNRPFLRRTGFSFPIPGLSYAVPAPDEPDGSETTDPGHTPHGIFSGTRVTDPASGTAERYALIPPDVPTAGPMPGGVSDRMLFVWEERRESATYMGSKVQGTTFVRQLSQTPVIANVILEFSASDSNREIKRWIATNTVLSIGVLLLLFTSVLVLLFLYQRTGNQRIREQEFVATMSHELRLPVTVIKAVADNIASGIALKPERLKRYGTELCLEANRLIGMVESILLYSGLQSGNLGVETVSIQLQELADSVISGFRSLTEQKGITLKANVTARPDTVIGDRKGIRTVMENLLMNAIIHAAPAHGQCTVILSIHRRPFDRLVVSVEDSGPGIPAREQKKIFSPFYRTRASVDGQHPGSGLGLHLVKRIVELNHGSVSVASPYTDTAGRLCTGARFTAEFRIDEAAANG